MSDGWKWPPHWRALRRATFARFGHSCYRCGRYADSIDHIVPVALGGDHSLHNLRPACSGCNSSTGASLGNRMRPPRPLSGPQRRAIAAKRLPGRGSRDW